MGNTVGSLQTFNYSFQCKVKNMICLFKKKKKNIIPTTLIMNLALHNMTIKSTINQGDALPSEGGSFSQIEYGVVVGTLFGDGCLVKRGNSIRLKIDHSIKQSSFVWWKHRALSRLCTTTQPPKVTTDKKGFQNLEFYTTSGTYLKPFQDAFYKLEANGRYKKLLTRELLEGLPLNPYILAVLFMDDGSVRNDCFSAKLAFHGFTKEEQELFVSIYLKRWGIKGTVASHTLKSGLHYINLSAATFGKFIQIIEPIVREIPEMEYKLNELRKPRND